ncbi:CoA pyrophosphatase, partial [Flavobacteriaceae bacterium]|nr:CoA pyrophosphatase [Flavobacteriaceae bacterium]
FPGGKVEKSDLNLTETALRETFEEVGILDREINIIREFTEIYIPPSNFLVTPFIGVCYNKPSFKKNNEVEEILEISYDDILDDNNIHFTQINNSYMEKTSVPCFQINGLIIWGATAMILSEIKEALKNIKP